MLRGNPAVTFNSTIQFFVDFRVVVKKHSNKIFRSMKSELKNSVENIIIPLLRSHLNLNYSCVQEYCVYGIDIPNSGKDTEEPWGIR